MHWLDRYSSGYHGWTSHKQAQDPRTAWYRRIGIVEGFFDTDGLEFEGRADLNAKIILGVSGKLSKEDRQDRILHAWATLRIKHVLLGSRALSGHELSSVRDRSDGLDERYFVITPPVTDQDVLQDARETITFVEDHYSDVDPLLFYRHVMNTARIFDASKHLSHLFVLPDVPSNPSKLQLVLVMGHQIADGLATYAWSASLSHLLNSSNTTLRSSWSGLLDPPSFKSRLPSAQEDLYPKVHPSNPARQRWHWLIARILRHVHQPPPRSFTNPLARPTGPIRSQPMPPTFSKVLDYDRTRTPPLNSFVAGATLPPPAMARLRTICKSLGVSIGAAAFTIAGMSMMALRERFPLPVDAAYPLDTTGLPFVGSFPVNARSFFGYKGPSDSLMLAFSDGIVLPFLPSSLGTAEARFRLLVRQADRQLGVYQKGARAGRKARALGAKSPGQLVPGNYLMHVERAEQKLREDVRQERAKRGYKMPQGVYTLRERNGLATCGVSSVSDRKVLLNTLDKQVGVEERDDDGRGWKVELEDLLAAVRVRDGEFLVGSAGDDRGLHFSVSYDGCTLDEDKVGVWKDIIKGLLEPGEEAVKARI